MLAGSGEGSGEGRGGAPDGSLGTHVGKERALIPPRGSPFTPRPPPNTITQGLDASAWIWVTPSL